MRSLVPSARPAVAALTVLSLVLAACGTPEPSASRSPQVLGDPGPSPANTPRSALPELEFRLRDATARHGALIQALGSASAGSAAEMRFVVGQMRDWVAGERAWLEEHPSERCFTAATDRFGEAIDAMAAAAEAFAADVSPSAAASAGRSSDPSPAASDSAAIHPGVQALQDASRGLLDAAALAETARRDCS